jgi:hypothetical protein
MAEPSTVVVLVTDRNYFHKALKTIEQLRGPGAWQGELVLLAVDFDPEPTITQALQIQVRRVHHIDTTKLVEAYTAHPLKSSDNRHTGKLTQWDKLQVFDPFFKAWERVLYFDAGLHIFHTIQPLLDLPWRGKFLAPDDSDPYDNGNRFQCQVQLSANPEAATAFLKDWPSEILDQKYFLNCLWVYDTALLSQVSMEEMIDAMNTYPICGTNEMTILNLFFTFKLKVWSPLPQRAGDKYLFGWCELNYRERPTWHSFHFLKYPVTIQR